MTETTDDAILKVIDDKFLTITQITEQLTSQGYEVNRNTVQVHIKRLSKRKEVFGVYTEGGKQGVVPLKFKKIPEF